MKATKFALIFAFVAFATMVFAQPERVNQKLPDPGPDPAPLSIKISLEKAIKNHELVSAMYQQLNPRFLQNELQRLYTAKVKFRKATYVIFGTRDGWKKFFIMDINDDPIGKKPINDEPLFKSAK